VADFPTMDKLSQEIVQTLCLRFMVHFLFEGCYSISICWPMHNLESFCAWQLMEAAIALSIVESQLEHDSGLTSALSGELTLDRSQEI
jgi:hypothetical protein